MGRMGVRMAELDKVIDGLECCMLSYKCGCDECPFTDKGMCQELLGESAIALLKSQVPRVMEPEELAALAMDESDNVPVWYEYRSITDRGVITRLEASVLWWVEDGWWRRLGPVRMGWEDIRADGYDVSWRVWTARPTEAQMEEMAWE